MQKSNLRKLALVAGCVAMGALSGSVAVFAHKGATGVVKERMELMERYDELTDRLFAMLHEELPYSADAVRKAAEAIKKTSGAHLVKLFPKGSDDKPSRATPDVWRNMETFEHFSEMLEVSADAVADTADKKPDGKTSLPKEMGRRAGDGPGHGSQSRPGRRTRDDGRSGTRRGSRHDGWPRTRRGTGYDGQRPRPRHDGRRRPGRRLAHGPCLQHLPRGFPQGGIAPARACSCGSPVDPLTGRNRRCGGPQPVPDHGRARPSTHGRQAGCGAATRLGLVRGNAGARRVLGTGAAGLVGPRSPWEGH